MSDFNAAAMRAGRVAVQHPAAVLVALCVVTAVKVDWLCWFPRAVRSLSLDIHALNLSLTASPVNPLGACHVRQDLDRDTLGCHSGGMTTTQTTATELEAALLARHMEIHELLAEIGNMADTVDPETANWGHVGDLGRIAQYLRYATGRES